MQLFKKKSTESLIDESVEIDNQNYYLRKAQLSRLSKQSVTDYIPIADIKDGIVITKDGRYIKIVEIEPANFQLRSAAEQNDVINRFASWLKIAPVKLHFKSVTQRADPLVHIRKVMKTAQQEGNKKCIALAKNYSQLVNEVSNNTALSRKFYAIFEYEGSVRNPKWIDVCGEFDNVINTMRTYFAQCGNRIITYDDENNAVMRFLYFLFNRDMAESLDFEDYKRYVDQEINKYNQSHSTETPIQPSIVDYIAPESISFVKGKATIVNNLFYEYLFLDSDGYNIVVNSGWLDMLVNAGPGIDVDVFARKRDREFVLNRLGNRIARNRSSVKTTNDTTSDYDRLEDTLESSLYIKNGITRNGEDPYDMAIMITVTASSLKNLEWRVNMLKKNLKAVDYMVRECIYLQEEAFKSVLPLNYISKEIFERAKRNVLTSGLASTYMFTSFELRDDNGIMYGINRLNNSICTVDIFNTRLHNNANIAIMGQSGSGKTFLLQLMASRMRMRGIQTFIIAPDKGTEFLRYCETIGGSFIKISAGSQQCINVMEIRQLDKTNDELIDGKKAVEKSVSSKLASKITQLHIFFSLIIPDLSYEEIQLLDDALIATYAKFGITRDNNSLIDPTDPQKKRYRKMPIIGDLRETLVEMGEDTKRLAIIINRLVNGSASSFNHQTNVDIRNPYVVIDIEELTGDLLPAGMFVALDYIWDIIKEDRTRQKAVFIDEAWQLIGGTSNKVAADFVVGIFKKIRAYSGSAICATQDLEDFFSLEDGKYGKAIINNSRTKIILNLERSEAEYVQETMDLTNNEVSSIVSAERGDALLCTANCKVAIKVKASELETAMITTDGAQLRQYIEKERAKMQRNQPN